VLDETELIGGQEKRNIIVVPYDLTWPKRFAAERERIIGSLGATARRADHIGSTSVPGLDAKPIIDIDLSVPDVEDESSYLAALGRAGYHLRVRQPGHRMVRTADLSVHVHVCADGSEWERRHLLFRDWLRRDTGDRQAYARTQARAGRARLAGHEHLRGCEGRLDRRDHCPRRGVGTGGQLDARALTQTLKNLQAPSRSACN
jgi:GrpB-like predicted nucleotidyltransferase (UPF0157 family)